jgi:DNA-binding transcriptional regulator YhcF (GntR family)
MMLSVDTESAVPPFEQIRAQISQLAASGELPTGTRLPSIRQLSADLGLAPGTVGRAYRELETDGVISARGRHGSFISGRPTTRKTAPAEAARSNPLRQAAADYARTAAQLGATASETVQTLAQLLAES